MKPTYLHRWVSLVLLLLCTAPFYMSGLPASQPARAAGQQARYEVVPPGYSSTIIHIKFREQREATPPLAAWPPGLTNAVARMTRLFTLSDQRLDELRSRGQQRVQAAAPASPAPAPPNLKQWSSLTLNPGVDAIAFIDTLRRQANVEIAEFAPLPAPPPATTPNFTGDQGYVTAAPSGIGAAYAWTVSGGNGAGITIYDVEYSWNQTHEDLSKAHALPLLLDKGDTNVDPFVDNNHGTAVLGELIADQDAKG